MIRNRMISAKMAAGALSLTLLAGGGFFAGTAAAGEVTNWVGGEEALTEGSQDVQEAEPKIVSEETIRTVLEQVVTNGTAMGILPENVDYEKLIGPITTGLVLIQNEEVRSLLRYEEVRDLADEVAERSAELVNTEPDTADKIFEALGVDETGAMFVRVVAHNWEEVSTMAAYLGSKLEGSDLSPESLETIAGEILEDEDLADAFLKIINEYWEAVEASYR